MAAPVPYDLSFQEILQPIIDIEQFLQQLADVQLKLMFISSVMEDHEMQMAQTTASLASLMVDHPMQMAMTTASNSLNQVISFYESARFQAQLNARNLIQTYMRVYGRLPSIDIHS